MGIDAEVTMIKPIAARPKVSHSKVRSYMIRLSVSFSREPITQPFSAVEIQTRILNPGRRGIFRRGRDKRINLTPSPDGQTHCLVVQSS
ncbi:Uncharacterised protein [Shigella sonnei]|nr:Uncharacterised protein [Shigella sonnei]